MKYLPTLLATLALTIGLARPAAAEQTITVTAIGQAIVTPDTVVLTGHLKESSEKMKDAITGFRDTRRRALASIKELDIEGLTVSTGELTLSLAGKMQGIPFGGMEQTEPNLPGSLTIRQSFTLAVKGIDQMQQQSVIELIANLMEGVKEAGIEIDSATDSEAMMLMQMGMGSAESSSATFTLSDPDAARHSATQDAIAKARADAALLAELAGGKLGSVVRISDSPTSTDNNASAKPYLDWIGTMTGDTDQAPYTRSSLDDITVQRALTVSFQFITQ